MTKNQALNLNPGLLTIDLSSVPALSLINEQITPLGHIAEQWTKRLRTVGGNPEVFKALVVTCHDDLLEHLVWRQKNWHIFQSESCTSKLMGPKERGVKSSIYIKQGCFLGAPFNFQTGECSVWQQALSTAPPLYWTLLSFASPVSVLNGADNYTRWIHLGWSILIKLWLALI